MQARCQSGTSHAWRYPTDYKSSRGFMCARIVGAAPDKGKGVWLGTGVLWMYNSAMNTGSSTKWTQPVSRKYLFKKTKLSKPSGSRYDTAMINECKKYGLVSDPPCNIRREGGQSLVIGASSLVILEGKACNPV